MRNYSPEFTVRHCTVDFLVFCVWNTEEGIHDAIKESRPLYSAVLDKVLPAENEHQYYADQVSAMTRNLKAIKAELERRHALKLDVKWAISSLINEANQFINK